jgi:hypothetical protein
VRYQVLDPSFHKGNLGGNLITVIDDISVVNMTPQQASYWLTQGAVLPLGAAGQLNYQLASRGLAVGSPIFDVPTENVKLFAPNVDFTSPAIDAPALGQVHVLAAARFATASPGIDVPVAVRTYPWLPLLNGAAPTMFADFRTGNCWFNYVGYNNPATWLAALGGTLTRASPATYFDRGILKIAAANVARFPTDINGNLLGIRLTGPATNMFPYSQGSATAWAMVNCSIVLNAAPAPDGTFTAFEIVDDTSNATHFVELFVSGSITASTVYTMSAFAKAGTRSQVILDALNFAGVGQGFDLNAGAMFAAGAPFNPPISAFMLPLADGWFFISMTLTASSPVANQTGGALYLYNNGNYSYQGDGVSKLYAWGVQITQTAFQVDYIPTTTAAVTQAGDVLSFPWAYQTYTGFVSTKDINLGSGAPRLLGSNASGPLFVYGDNPVFAGSYNTSSAVASSTIPGNYRSLQKQIVGGSPAGRSITMDGAVPVSDANTFVTAADTVAYLGSNDGIADWADGHYRQVALWANIVGSPTEMQRLTKFAVELATASPVIDVVQTNSWLPLVSGVQPFMFADFSFHRYWANDATYDSFTGWLAAFGGTFTRSTTATYLDRGVLRTAAVNAPRFPTDINAHPTGIRLTGPATNIQLHSALDSGWVGQVATLTPNAGSDPSGGSAAASLLPTAGSGVHGTAYAPGINGYVAGQTYTTSAFIKPFGPNTYAVLLDTDNSLTNYSTFSLSGSGSVNSNVGNGVGKITLLANGWFLISVTGTSTYSGNVNSALAAWDIAGATRIVNTDGVSGWFVWGWQITNTNFLCDYIPVTTAPVTQAADNFQFPFTQQTFSALASTVNQNFDKTGTQRILDSNGHTPIYIASLTDFGQFDNGGAIVAAPAVASVYNANMTMVAGNSSSVSITSNGQVPNTGAGALMSTVPPVMNIGNSGVTSDYAYGDFKAVGIWNGIVASAAEMQRLTKLPIVATDLSTAPPAIDVVSTNSWLPLVGSVKPSFYSDFMGKHFWSGVLVYDSFAGWLAALGGTFSRASPASYFDRGILKTAAANTPRFPTDINGNPTGIRLTGPATNLQLNSSISSNTGAFNKGDTGSLIANNGPDPSGGFAAALYIPDTGPTSHLFYDNETGPLVNGTTYTYSIFAKPKGYTNFRLSPNNSALGADFSMVGAGSILSSSSCTPSIVALANGWYLCSLTFVSPDTGTWKTITAFGNTSAQSFNGDGVSGYYFWGLQFTETNFLVDYIPTTTAAMSQAADVLTAPTSGWLSTVGSTLASSGFAAAPAGGALQTAFAFNNSTGNYNPAGAAALLRLGNGNIGEYEVGGVGSAANVVSTSNANYKVAGVLNVPTTLQRVVTPSASNENNTLDFTGVGTAQLRIGALDVNDTQPFQGDMKSMGYWPAAATVAQAQALLGQLP